MSIVRSEPENMPVPLMLVTPRPMSVSYTHLDVYKRQVLLIANALVFWKRVLPVYKKSFAE